MKDSQNSKKKKISAEKRKQNPFLHAIIFLSSITIILIFLTIFMVGKVSTTQLNAIQSQPVAAAHYPHIGKDMDLRISAEAAIVYDRDARVSVYEKNASTRFTPASTVKIMTALVAREAYEPDDVLTAKGVSSVVGSSMGLIEGERIRVRDLLYGLMLPSGNDAAYTLATHYPDGGYDGFVRRMNEKAKELHIYNSRYIDPAGFDDANYTTPSDLARLADAALSDPLIQKIAHTKRITVTNANGTVTHDLENLNRLLDYTDVYGLKTGFTNEAGQVLVTSVHEGQGEYLLVVMKSEDRFRDTEILMADVVRKIELLTF